MTGEKVMEEQILKIKQLALADIEKAQNTKELEEVKNKYLSRSSELNNFKKS